LTIPQRPYVWPWLIAANLAGAVYGYYWYGGQLRATPLYLWPFTPDCPLFASLFALVLLLKLSGRPAEQLATITYLGLIKYGVWTVTVIGSYWLLSGDVILEDIFLFISHAGMIVEGLLMLPTLTWRFSWVEGAAIFFVVWDWFDYVVGTYPYLPAQYLLPLATWTAIVMTVALLGFAGRQAVQRKRKQAVNAKASFGSRILSRVK